jgi:hypothetical protein
MTCSGKRVVSASTLFYRKPEKSASACAEHRNVKRFEEASVGACLFSSLRDPSLVVASDAEDGHVFQLRVTPNEATHLEAVNSGQKQVQDQKVGTKSQQFHPSVDAIGGGFEHRAWHHRAKGAHDDVQDSQVVVHDEDSVPRGRRFVPSTVPADELFEVLLRHPVMAARRHQCSGQLPRLDPVKDRRPGHADLPGDVPSREIQFSIGHFPYPQWSSRLVRNGSGSAWFSL